MFFIYHQTLVQIMLEASAKNSSCKSSKTVILYFEEKPAEMLSNVKFADKPSWAGEPECITCKEAAKSEIDLRRKT